MTTVFVVDDHEVVRRGCAEGPALATPLLVGPIA